MKLDLKEKISIDEGVEVNIEDSTITISSGSNKVARKCSLSNVTLAKEEGNIVLSAKNATKREKRIINTLKSQLKNMIKGVKEPYVYKLAICSSHFPMTVSVEKDELVIKNFLGEKVPRKLKLGYEGVDVKIDGNTVIVTSSDKEKAGLVAGKIEKLTVIKGRDKRVFQDGCYIIDKAGKLIK